MCMKSLSEIAKEVIRGYMENGNEYDRKELVAAIKEGAERKEEMTDGVIAGAIKMLTASGEIMVVARGRYKKGVAGKDQNMQERVTALFHRFKADLDKMCMVNALSLKENDLQFISKLNEISNNLEASIWELEDFAILCFPFVALGVFGFFKLRLAFFFFMRCVGFFELRLALSCTDFLPLWYFCELRFHCCFSCFLLRKAFAFAF